MSDESVNQVMSALADPTRRHIVELLSGGSELTLSEITGHFGMSRQAVSKHLAVLNQAGIVSSERKGRDRSNRLQPRALAPLREWFNCYSVFWDDRLLALKQQVEEDGS